MELEAWHLLVLPLFFALGWAAARVDIRHLLRESRAVPASYFQGLNYLLNEQPDRAIEAFVEVAKVNADTLELHYALGALFRKRGEIDRAIRMHQNLVDRADLNQEQSLRALFELGLDYMKAGLLDRAEDIFKRLQDSPHALDARQNLLEIYVLEKEWQQAIAMAEELERSGLPAQNAETAHYHCELALNALLRQDTAAVRASLNTALAKHRKSVRVSIQLGELEAQAGDVAAAIAAWRQVESQNPAYLPIVADRLYQAYKRQGQAEQGLQLLKAYLERYPSADLFHIVFNILVEHRGWGEARALAAEALKRTPSLRVLDDYLQARSAESEPGDLETRMAQDLVHRQVSRTSHYQCGRCGFKARQFFWQCPACAGWDSIAPEKVQHEH
jgi:lipopolysaccharide biosynthesis regulator YciM